MRLADLRHLVRLRVLPPRVALFEWRAHRLATQTSDSFSLASATRAPDLAVVLELARGRRRVVELGTGTGWTALALALADPERRVVSYDPIHRPERERYVALAGARAGGRVEFITEDGAAGPRDQRPVDLLYIDSAHERQATIDELAAWRPVLRAGAIVVFDDFTHPEYPGVREAVAELELSGTQQGTLFVHRV